MNIPDYFVYPVGFFEIAFGFLLGVWLCYTIQKNKSKKSFKDNWDDDDKKFWEYEW